MEEHGYKGGGTIGGRWGCGVAALVCTPLFFFLIIVNTLGDCPSGSVCNKGALLPIVVPVAVTGAVIGLAVRALVNWIAKRLGGGR